MTSSSASVQRDTEDADAIGVRLDHASIMTTDLDESTTFYVDLLGLTLRTVEDDPVRDGRERAMLGDGRGRAVIELIEMPEMEHAAVPGRGAIHHIGFRLSRESWHSLRARLDAANYSYREVKGRLFVRDADGLVLEIEQE